MCTRKMRLWLQSVMQSAFEFAAIHVQGFVKPASTNVSFKILNGQFKILNFQFC